MRVGHHNQGDTMTGVPGLIAKLDGGYHNQETVNDDHRVGGPYRLPVEPDQMSHHERIVVVNDTGADCMLRLTAEWKGTVLWMPNTGTDRNYVNCTYWRQTTKHSKGVAIDKPNLDAMKRVKKVRSFATPGHGTSRHMVTANGTGFLHTTKLKDGQAATYWLASAAQIDESGAGPGVQPTIYAWGGIGWQWELVTL